MVRGVIEMKVDLHLHTTFSDCSSLGLEMLIKAITEKSHKIITVTDHGNIKACQWLANHVPDIHVLMGIEVTCAEGDFLIYSTNEEYLLSLGPFLDSVENIRRDKDTAVIWAHPRIPQQPFGQWAAPNPSMDQTREVLKCVDGIEVYNGTMLDLASRGLVKPTYFENLVALSKESNITLSGGSDAHELDNLCGCWTNFPNDVETAQDLIDCIKGKKIRPAYDKRRFDLAIAKP